MAVTGIGMLSVVHSKSAWVEANFKEKDLARMVPGQRATIEIDAYSGRKWAGKVCSIGAGTGNMGSRSWGGGSGEGGAAADRREGGAEPRPHARRPDVDLTL